LSNAVQPYDVLFFPDGDLRTDTLTGEALRQYRTIVLPDCRFLTQAQSQLLQEYLEHEGRLLVMGELGANLSHEEREAILNHEGTRRVEVGAAFDLNWLPFGQQVNLSVPADLAINLQRVEAGVVVHILRYDYDPLQDRVPALEELHLDLRLPGKFGSLEVFSPGEPPQAELEVSGESPRIALKNIPLYSILLLKQQPV
jgi:hypothetical protein